MDTKTILIVDDEKLLRWGLRVNLEKCGFQVKEAKEGQQALDLLAHESFCLLLTDYLMAGMNGDELIRQAKRKNNDLKTILFTGYMEEGLENDKAFCGIDFFLKKPIDFKHLVATIDTLLATGRQTTTPPH